MAKTPATKPAASAILMPSYIRERGPAATNPYTQDCVRWMSD